MRAQAAAADHEHVTLSAEACELFCPALTERQNVMRNKPAIPTVQRPTLRLYAPRKYWIPVLVALVGGGIMFALPLLMSPSDSQFNRKVRGTWLAQDSLAGTRLTFLPDGSYSLNCSAGLQTKGLWRIERGGICTQHVGPSNVALHVLSMPPKTLGEMADGDARWKPLAFRSDSQLVLDGIVFDRTAADPILP